MNKHLQVVDENYLETDWDRGPDLAIARRLRLLQRRLRRTFARAERLLEEIKYLELK